MRMVLFTGKGGVGKTTLAAATAAHLARSGRKTLAVSTDPAHSLGDALEAELGGEPTEVDGVGGLFAAHVDARALLEGAWGRLRDHLATVLAGAGVDELVADELTVLPGVEELLALAAVQRAAQAGPWDVVVVDCGPTAETLRLLALPEAVGGYLERLFPAHRRALRGLMTRDRSDARRWDRTVEALDGLAGELADLRALLASPQTGIRLVLTPERVVAAETRRTLTALALLGLHVDGLVANRMVPVPPPDAPGEAARWLRERGGEQAAVLADLERLGTPLRTVGHTAAEPTGVEALLVLAAQLWGDDDPAAEQRAGGTAAGGPAHIRQRPLARLGVRTRAAPARCGGGAAGPDPDRRRAGGDGGGPAADGGTSRGAAAVHGDPGPARRRRSPGGVPSGPGAVAPVTGAAVAGRR